MMPSNVEFLLYYSNTSHSSAPEDKDVTVTNIVPNILLLAFTHSLEVILGHSEQSGGLSVACLLRKSDTSQMLLCKKHIIERAELIFSYIYPAEEAAGSKSRQSLSWRNQTDGTDNWQTDTRTDRKTNRTKHGRQKEGRRQTAEESRTDRVNASGMGL